MAINSSRAAWSKFAKSKDPPRIVVGEMAAAAEEGALTVEEEGAAALEEEGAATLEEEGTASSISLARRFEPLNLLVALEAPL